MSTFQIIVGSMLGGTEYVAEACEEQLITLEHKVNLHLKPNFSSIIEETFSQNSIWLICTSTHGAGDYPDNIQEFVNDLKNCEQDLSSIKFMIIAIGDSSYDTFCKAGLEIKKLLITKGCSEIVAIEMFDMSQDIDPEDLAQQWLIQNKDLL
ncbi:flavodoxin domain-containing protein [Colwellia sp. MSW7]|uniref:Flavodoxin domain-containing protein n=1 Tax=Colwellia maritima TaxID=2912588 RepID=A0ABS9WWL5_9GAMM|nr:flavodoxin domain-containing protein [Colwellia maritima]MCI2282319.1 flavodoxin domain-containing protein [Colwellia maritima]